MHHRKHLDERVDGRAGIDDDAGLHAMLLDQLKRPVEVTADLLVDGDHVRAGLGEGGDEVVGLLDHEMAVERQLGDRSQRLDHGRTEGDVWNEVAVHHIHMDDGSATAFSGGNILCQAREVRSQYRKCQLNHRQILLGRRNSGQLKVYQRCKSWLMKS